MTTVTAQTILDFWFEELSSQDWFRKSDELDTTIRTRFETTLIAARQCELYEWRTDIRGRLAEIIVLDQFSRNIHRDTPLAFAADPLALGLAQEAVQTGEDTTLKTDERAFLYMPYMHSESALIHETAETLFSALPTDHYLSFEQSHRAIIDTYGRYPHRNDILGRTTSDEERDFLAKPNSSF